jgi:hypothetical protein
VRASRRTVGAAFLAVALAVTVALAALVAPHGSDAPDGLQRVALDEGFAGTETEHATAGSPTAGYRTVGVDHDALATGVAGVIGVAVTFALGAGVVLVAQRARRSGRDRARGPAAPASPSS